jgi:macrolide-specific efflux system membrane fusion protein
MSAEVTIVIAQADGAVAVPAIAISGTSGSYVVRVMAADGTIESRAVEVGLIASDYAEITSGIAEGETVVTGSSADRSTTATTTTTTGRDGFGGGFGGLNGAGGGLPAGAPPQGVPGAQP